MTDENTQQKPQHQDQVLKGIAYVCAAFFMFTLMQAFNKLLTGQHHVIEISFYRNLMAIIPCAFYIALTKRYDLLKTGMPLTMTFRVLIGTTGLVLTFAAAQHLPLSDATVLFFLSTLLTPVLAFFFLKEHIGIHRWAAVGIGMIGVMLVAQPKGDVAMIGVAMALGAATVHAIIQVLIRAMKTEDPFTITFYFFLGGVIIPGLAMPFVASTPDAMSWLILLGIGLTGGLGQYFLTRGFQMAPASLLSPFSYTGLIWATGLDIIIWQYIPGWPVFLGAAIIIASKFYIIYREKRATKKADH